LWFPLTPVSFDQVNPTAVTDEHFNWENIENVDVFHVGESKIEIGDPVIVPNHLTSISLGSAVVDHVVSGPFVKPSVFDLNPDHGSRYVEDKVIRQPITNGPQHSPTTLESL
jgi:acetyltransferase-like isoleucine patch superfamily enzyme